MSRNRTRSRFAPSHERGAAAVEFALVMPILLLFVLGIIDFGRLWFTQVTLTQAAREGVRVEALNSDATAMVIQQTQRAATGISTPSVTVQLIKPDNTVATTATSDPGMSCTTGNDAKVRTSTSFTFTLGALIGIAPKTLAGYGRMPCGG
jgi:Flp pilus assembly protein TadG